MIESAPDVLERNPHKSDVLEEAYIFQVGFYIGQTKDKLEIKYHQQNH